MWIALLALGCSRTEPGDGPPGDSGEPTTHPGQDSGEPLPDPDQRQQNLTSAAGDFASDFLRAEPYDRLVIELDWVAGHRPGEDAVAHLLDVIEAVCDKVAVEVVLDDEIPSQGSPVWTVEAAEDLELAWRDRYRDPDSGTAVLYGLYVDGSFEADDDQSRVLGFAYHGSSLVMMAETIADTESALPPLLGGGSVEETVLAHELGHLLGLVNNGVSMVEPHQDAAQGAHCDDEGCLMYWAVETDLVGSLLGNGTPDFDDRCLADLAAARAGP